MCTEHGPPDARVYERTQTRKRQQVQRIKLAERCGIQPVSELDPQVPTFRSKCEKMVLFGQSKPTALERGLLPDNKKRDQIRL